MAFNVLIVDDSAVMRAMILKTLRLSGLSLGDIYEASNGEEGLHILNNNWVDLALVDINMPVMAGDEMISRVRQNPETRDLSIVVVSTDSSESTIEMLNEKGAGFVHKPFTPETLRETILSITGAIGNEQFRAGSLPGSSLDF